MTRAGNIVNKTVIYVVFVLISIAVFYPLVYVVAGAFAPGSGISDMSIVPFTREYTVDDGSEKNGAVFDKTSDSYRGSGNIQAFVLASELKGREVLGVDITVEGAAAGEWYTAVAGNEWKNEIRLSPETDAETQAVTYKGSTSDPEFIKAYITEGLGLAANADAFPSKVSVCFSVKDTGPVPETHFTFKGAFTLKHFKYLFTQTQYWLWFKNTLVISLWTALLTVIISSISAYVFSRFHFVFKKTLMMSLLVLQIFPSFVGMIAIYVILNRIGGLDTLWGLVLVYVAGNIPYNTWMVKSYMDTVSRNLDEAARIDGASHFRIYSTIILPVTKPIITFLAISSFTGPWMDFIFPKMVLRSPEKQTLAIGLFSFVSDKKQEFTTFAAGSLIISIPFIIFFLLTQRSMMVSMGSGAVKE